jgi:hypothetical protein
MDEKEDILNIIKNCIRKRNIIWTYHVNMRLIGRSITRGEILSSVDSFEIIEEYPDDKYLPSYLIYSKGNNDILHILVGLDKRDERITIITAYKPKLDKWQEDFKIRREK